MSSGHCPQPDQRVPKYQFPNINVLVHIPIYKEPYIYQIANRKYFIKSLDDIAWLVLLRCHYQTYHLQILVTMMIIVIITILQDKFQMTLEIFFFRPQKSGRRCCSPCGCWPVVVAILECSLLTNIYYHFYFYLLFYIYFYFHFNLLFYIH